LLFIMRELSTQFARLHIRHTSVNNEFLMESEASKTRSPAK
jgi:hypothetical protein